MLETRRFHLASARENRASSKHPGSGADSPESPKMIVTTQQLYNAAFIANDNVMLGSANQRADLRKSLAA
jgi:hypothetical protein